MDNKILYPQEKNLGLSLNDEYEQEKRDCLRRLAETLAYKVSFFSDYADSLNFTSIDDAISHFREQLLKVEDLKEMATNRGFTHD